MAKKNLTVPVRIDYPVYEALRLKAVEHGVSITKLVNQLLSVNL